MITLKSVDLKLARAIELAREIDAKIGEWKVVPDVIKHSGGFDTNNTRFVVRIVAIERQDLLDDISVRTGEIVHNLRSALDNLIFALARLDHDPPPQPKKLAFPIFTERDATFLRAMTTICDQAGPEVALVLMLMQPFHRHRADVEATPDSDPLKKLAALSNSDKHQVPHVVACAFTDGDIKFEMQAEYDGSGIPAPHTHMGRPVLEPGLEIVQVTSPVPMLHMSFSFELSARLFIALGDEILPLEDTLTQLIWYVRLVVDQFRPRFA